MIIVTSGQLRETCWRRWYYRYHLWLNPWAEPLGEEPEPVRIGKDVHRVILEDAPPETDYGKIIHLIKDNIVYEEKLELLEAEKAYFCTFSDGILLAGRVDGVGKLTLPDNDESFDVLYELKTSAYKPREGYWLQKELDLQLTLYSYLTGCGKIVLDFIRLPAFARDYWQDRWSTKVLNAIKDNVSAYFARLVIEKRWEELGEFEEEIMVWAEMLDLQLRKGVFLKNPMACNEYRRTCEFWKLCKGELKPEDCQTVEPFEELQPELDEFLNKKGGELK